MVCADIARRQAHGLAKYGVTVAESPLTAVQWARHLYEELLDGAVYAKRLMPLIVHLEECSTMLSQIGGHVAHLCGPNDTTLDGVKRLATDLAARDALIGELREQLILCFTHFGKEIERLPLNESAERGIQSLSSGCAMVPDKTPAGAGAEMERLRKERDEAIHERNCCHEIYDAIRRSLGYPDGTGYPMLAPEVANIITERDSIQAKLAFIAKHYANAIHYCCRVDGDEWNTDFYGTLDRTMARYAKRDAERNGQAAATSP